MLAPVFFYEVLSMPLKDEDEHNGLAASLLAQKDNHLNQGVPSHCSASVTSVLTLVNSRPQRMLPAASEKFPEMVC
jgi:hypothetical protein